MSARCPFQPFMPTQTAPAEDLSLTAELKLRTREQHDAAEHHEAHAILFGSCGPALARETYVRLLGQHLTIQEAFEGELIRLCENNELVHALHRPHHRHLHALREDLKALAVPSQQRKPSLATRATADFIRASSAEDAAAFIGVFYVLEGSTNGGTIIAKRLRDILQLESDAGTRYINPHGAQVRARWQEWKQSADALTMNASQRERACNAAGAMFTHMQQILTEIRADLPQGAPCAAEIAR